MFKNRSNGESIPAHTESHSQEEKYLGQTEELREILTFDDPSPSRMGSYVWIDARIVQTSDGPENAMFYVSSTNRSSARKGRTQC